MLPDRYLVRVFVFVFVFVVAVCVSVAAQRTERSSLSLLERPPPLRNLKQPPRTWFEFVQSSFEEA